MPHADGKGKLAEVRRAAQAQADLEEILRYLESKSGRAADQFASGLDRKCDALSRLPEIGRTRAVIAPGIRSTLVGKYVVFYRIAGDVVEILRILHGRRDLRHIVRNDS